MKFVLLGAEPRVLWLMDQIQQHPEHDLPAAYQIGELEEPIRARFPNLEVVTRWQDLLAEDELQAVILCGNDQDARAAASRLVEAGKQLLLFPNAGQGAEFFYSLSLMYDENPCVLYPWFAEQFDPVITQLKALLKAGEFGEILYWQVQRDYPARSPVPMTPKLIDEKLLPDVALLRYLSGDYSRVTAMHSGANGETVSLATVTLTADTLPEATWTIQPGDRENWRLLVVGTTGKALITREDELAPLELILENDSVEIKEYQPDCLAGFLEFCELSPGKALWQELIRCQETVEATYRSRRRRRTIDLHFESLSERSQFKSHMTAIGCGILFYTLFAVIGVLIVGGIFPLKNWVMHTLRVVAFGPLVLFLILQVLIVLAQPDASRKETDSSPQ